MLLPVAIDVYNNSQSCLNYPFSTLQVYKASNMEQETSLRPFYCNYNFTCSISAHAQTLNEYPDAKNTFEYQNNERIFIAALIPIDKHEKHNPQNSNIPRLT